jgi:CRISPR-associated protein Cmr6
MNLRLPASHMVLDAIHSSQTTILMNLATRDVMVWEFRARLQSPYVSGLGSGHPTETGMILDRNSGLPFIPASAVKGVLRLVCALHIAETEPGAVLSVGKDSGQCEVPDSHPLLRRYFGDTDTGGTDSVRGQLVFLDAFPAAVPTIRADILNPHFGKYYAGTQGPLETENPIPVKFLSVAEGIEFVFRCLATPLPSTGRQTVDPLLRPFDDTDEQAVIAMFTRAFNQLGFGGKTSIGYGRFVPTSVRDTAAFMEMIKKDLEEKKQQDRLRRQEEEDRKFPWRKPLREIGEIVDWGMLRQKVLDNKNINIHKSNPEVGAAIKEISLEFRKKNLKKWDVERDQFIAEWLTASETTWEPTSRHDITEKPSVLSIDDQREVDRIKGLKDWGQWKNANLKISDLSLAAADELSKLFAAWKINNKAKSDEKKKAARELSSHLKSTRSKT